MTTLLIATAKQWARTIKRDVHAIWLASREPRTPWFAKVLALALRARMLAMSLDSECSAPLEAWKASSIDPCVKPVILHDDALPVKLRGSCA